MLKLENGQYFSYEMVGEFHSESCWIHPRRTITSFELILVLEGAVRIEEEGVRYELQSGDMLFLEPGKAHGGFCESTEQVGFYWFHFLTNIPLPFKVCKGAEIYEVKYLLKRLLHITNQFEDIGAAADAAGVLLLEELQQCSRQSCADTALIHQVAEYARINADRNVTVAEIAEHFGYHPDYIGRLFKKHFQTGLKEYIGGMRIKKAKDLLLFTTLTVEQAALELGWSDANTFIKFFTYHEKISPKAFRNLYFRTHMNNK